MFSNVVLTLVVISSVKEMYPLEHAVIMKDLKAAMMTNNKGFFVGVFLGEVQGGGRIRGGVFVRGVLGPFMETITGNGMSAEDQF